MKFTLTTALSLFLISSSSMAQRAVVVRGVGTQTCAKLLAASKSDNQFEIQATQWVLGNLTGYFRQATDDPSGKMGDVMLVQTVFDVCGKSPEKTIDEAVTIVISALPQSESRSPVRSNEVSADGSSRGTQSRYLRALETFDAAQPAILHRDLDLR